MTPETDQLARAPAGLVAPSAEAPTPPDPGRRHAECTLDQMLREAVRDVVAIRRLRGPIEALVIGSGNAVLARSMLNWGVRRVVGIDERAEALDAGPPHPGLELHRVESITGPAPAEIGSFAIVVVTEAAGIMCADRPALLRLARGCATQLCAVDSRDRLGDRDLVRDAGFDRISLAPPPTDSERRWILGERSLILARIDDGAST